ncbi:MAG: hypothetical protein J6L69_07710 [Lachnospiraceae bacterium]|nr:hypothetical protein [Lachnospiraceae bacterium]
MGFVYEVVPEEDREFFKSMGLKDCWGREGKNLSEYTEWCADREKNAYLVGIGGGLHEMPYFYDFWWNGNTIRMEISEGGSGNYETGVDIIWIIEKLPIPQKVWKNRDEIMKMIEEAFSVDSSGCKKQFLKSISVRFDCEPEMEENE